MPEDMLKLNYMNNGLDRGAGFMSSMQWLFRECRWFAVGFGNGRQFAIAQLKGDTAEGALSIPVGILSLGCGRICHRLSQQWSAIMEYEEK